MSSFTVSQQSSFAHRLSFNAYDIEADCFWKISMKIPQHAFNGKLSRTSLKIMSFSSDWMSVGLSVCRSYVCVIVNAIPNQTKSVRYYGKRKFKHITILALTTNKEKKKNEEEQHAWDKFLAMFLAIATLLSLLFLFHLQSQHQYLQMAEILEHLVCRQLLLTNFSVPIIRRCDSFSKFYCKIRYT